MVSLFAFGIHPHVSNFKKTRHQSELAYVQLTKTQNLTYADRFKLVLSVKQKSLSCVTSFAMCDKLNGKICHKK